MRLWRAARKIEPLLLGAYKVLTEPPTPNLKGDRDIEYSWVVANIPNGPGAALDFGCGNSWLGLAAARKGFTVTALDTLPIVWPYRHASLEFVQGDIAAMPLPARRYDLLICCSTIEHVGLSGRYGTEAPEPQADLAVMRVLLAATKAGGLMLLTIPVGRDGVVRPWHRVYGPRRVPRLLEGWRVLRSEYWVKDQSNLWIPADEGTAMAVDASDHYYSLGLFVLSPDDDPDRDARYSKPC